MDALKFDLKFNVEFYRKLETDYEEALGPHPIIPNGQYLRRITEMREELLKARAQIESMQKLLRHILYVQHKEKALSKHEEGETPTVILSPGLA